MVSETGRPESLIERTARRVSARLTERGDGSEDTSPATILRALHRCLDQLEEDVLMDWEECLVGCASPNVPMRFAEALQWARRD